LDQILAGENGEHTARPIEVEAECSSEVFGEIEEDKMK